jgi:hypothetical protein
LRDTLLGDDRTGLHLTQSGNLLGRVRNHVVGTIEAGSSELFEVIIETVFSDNRIETSSYQVEVDISYDE